MMYRHLEQEKTGCMPRASGLWAVWLCKAWAGLDCGHCITASLVYGPGNHAHDDSPCYKAAWTSSLASSKGIFSQGVGVMVGRQRLLAEILWPLWMLRVEGTVPSAWQLDLCCNPCTKKKHLHLLYSYNMPVLYVLFFLIVCRMEAEGISNLKWQKKKNVKEKATQYHHGYTLLALPFIATSNCLSLSIYNLVNIP